MKDLHSPSLIVYKTKTQIKKEERKALKIKDAVWSVMVKKRDDYKCVICGKTKYLNSHHIIPRQNKKFRHELDNGITLCAGHHKFYWDLSAHKNPFIFYPLLEDYISDQLCRLRGLYYE